MHVDPLRSLPALVRELSGPGADHLREELNRWPARGMEAAYAEASPRGLLVLGLPREVSPAEAPYASALAWCWADETTAHVRYLSLKRLVALTREELPDETRLVLHFPPPVSTTTLVAHGDVLRAYARALAERMQGWLAAGHP